MAHPRARLAWSVKPMPFANGTFQPAAIGHLMSVYDAAFYGYLWSEVCSDDRMTPFRSSGLLCPAVGAACRAHVLEAPILADPADGVRAFPGREPSSDAFFARIAGGDDPDPSERSVGPARTAGTTLLQSPHASTA